MAPTPTPSPPPEHAIPPLHLQVLNLKHDGAQRFFSHTSSPYSALEKSCETVLAALYPPTLVSEHGSPAPGPPTIRSITLHVRPFGGVAHTCDSDLDEQHKEVHLSADYVAQVGGDSRRINHEIRGVLVHELVHVFQWNGHGSCPGGVIEGIADWVRLGADLGPPHWREGGDRWDAGYQTTAYFLAWLSTKFKNPLLVPELNLALRLGGWEDGKTLRNLCHDKYVEDLWDEYKEDLEKRRKKEQEHEQDPPKPVPTHTAGGGGYSVQ
uniref:Plant basic secretory protein n=1 Tax=Leucosporidium scottii TaxID=5278 RepID=A0A0H5GA76_9BASI|nr:hypothetical protein ls5931a1_00059 [Leucosporidium scottii]